MRLVKLYLLVTCSSPSVADQFFFRLREFLGWVEGLNCLKKIFEKRLTEIYLWWISTGSKYIICEHIEWRSLKSVEFDQTLWLFLVHMFSNLFNLFYSYKFILIYMLIQRIKPFNQLFPTCILLSYHRNHSSKEYPTMPPIITQGYHIR